MKVTLIDYTGKGAMKNVSDLRGAGIPNGTVACVPDHDYAIDLLIFTKSTRLTMHPGLLDEIKAWPLEKKMTELNYMANTIPSSWEFVDYTFMIEGVSRGFTHQFVRSRQFSFAQQTMRVLDVSSGPGWDYHTGPTIPNVSDMQIEHLGGDEYARGNVYHNTMRIIDHAYSNMIKNGAAIEDARGILPTNILTNIVGKCNMRTFVELVRKRSSPRTQSEYRDVLEAMKNAVREVHPWIDIFIDRTFDQAANELCDMIKAWTDDSGEAGHLTPEVATKIIKLVDQMRGQS